MKQDVFEKLLDELDGNSVETLKSKNAKYAKDSGDCLHNFKVGAEIMGRTTAQTCWGYMTKHLADLRKKVDANDFSDREDFLEKCQDTINYIRFLWCIGNEENVNKKLEPAIEKDESVPQKLTVKNKHTGRFDMYHHGSDFRVYYDSEDYVIVFYDNPHGIRQWTVYDCENYEFEYGEERKDNHE